MKAENYPERWRMLCGTVVHAAQAAKALWPEDEYRRAWTACGRYLHAYQPRGSNDDRPLPQNQTVTCRTCRKRLGLDND